MNKTLETLEKELERLVIKWGFGKDLVIRWLPAEQKRIELFQKNGELAGEVSDNVIRIYERRLDRAIHILHHEFFEWVEHNNLVKPYDLLWEVMFEAYKRLTYERKESLIERLAEQEDEEFEKLQKESS